jgi:hypothetical protein
LEEVLKLNPDNQTAKRGLAKLQQSQLDLSATRPERAPAAKLAEVPTVINFAPPVQEPEISAFEKLIRALGVVILVVIVGGVVWALVGYFFKIISIGIAWVIGLAVAFAYAAPFKPINLAKVAALFIPSIVSALMSILLGEFILTTLLIVRDFNYPLLDATLLVVLNAGEIFTATETVASLVLGAIGSILGYANLLRARR